MKYSDKLSNLNLTDLRKKEDQLNERLLNNKVQTSSAENDMACNVINETIASPNGKVYVSTDWHLFRKLDDNHRSICNKARWFDHVINTYSRLTKDDLLIYLGDFVDGEFREPNKLKEILDGIKCKKIMTMGNNDLFGKSFYKSCGFSCVMDSFIWHDIKFSHFPKENLNKLNIHGHIHGHKIYWIPYTNQVDAFKSNREPYELFELINKQPEYSKSIKINKNHSIYSECDVSSLFEQTALGSICTHIDDPYTD